MERRKTMYATDTDWDHFDARQRSEERPDQAWVLTDRDVWHANPFYVGPPQPHPEDYPFESEEDREATADAPASKEPKK